MFSSDTGAFHPNKGLSAIVGCKKPSGTCSLEAEILVLLAVPRAPSQTCCVGLDMDRLRDVSQGSDFSNLHVSRSPGGLVDAERWAGPRHQV